MSNPQNKLEALSKSAATRIRILDAAARVFRDKGYAATTLIEIADAAHMRAGSLYYHFDSKEELVEEVIEVGMLRVVDAVKNRVERLPRDATFDDRLEAAVSAHLELLLKHGDYTSANIRIFGQVPDEVQRRQLRHRRAYGKYWHSLLETAKRRGEIRADANLGAVRMLILGALNWTVEWFDPSGKPVDALVAEATILILQGIAPRPRR